MYRKDVFMYFMDLFFVPLVLSDLPAQLTTNDAFITRPILSEHPQGHHKSSFALISSFNFKYNIELTRLTGLKH